MIALTLRPIAGSRVAVPTKSGIAIGIGATLPCVTSSLSTAAARFGKETRERGRRAARAHHEQPAAVQRPANSSRSALDHGSVLWGDGTDRHPRIHVAWIEGNLDVFPLLVVLGPQHVIGLTAEQRANGAVARSDEKRAPAAGQDHRRTSERAVGLELDAHQHHQLLRILGAGRDAPELREPLTQRIELAHR